MALGGTYETGTITVAAGGTTVTGAGTFWAAVVEDGDFLIANGHIGFIQSVTDNTHLDLAQPWTGGALAGSLYLIVKMSWLRYEPSLTQAKVRALLETLTTQTVLYSVTDAAPDPALGEEGQCALKANAWPWRLWLKAGGVWVEQNPWPNVSTNARVLGRKSAGAGAIEELTLSEILDFVGAAAQGDLLYRGAAGWVRLAAGGAGQALVTGGANANPSWATRREVLTANRTYYVRVNLGTCTISIATPAVVTKAAHGLQANDPVVFSILPNTKICTISEANPGIVTANAHGFANGQPVKLQSTIRLPKNLSQNTTYYVKNSTTNTFELEPTIGGGSVNTTAPAVTISIASPAVVTLNAHGLANGDPVVLATTGALPTGLAAGTTYFVKTVVDANNFQVSDMPDGAAINTSGAQSGTHTLVQGGLHRLEMVGALPTGLTEGAVCYVKTVQDADHFTVTNTPGSAAINTSGTQSGVISVATGNDANDGLAATRSGALLSVQAGYNKVAALDLSTYAATIQLADSKYVSWQNLNITAVPVGTVQIVVQGNAATPGNVWLNGTGGTQLGVWGPAQIRFQNFRVDGSANALYVKHVAAQVDFIGLDFGAISDDHIRVDAGLVTCSGNYTISGGAQRHLLVGGMGGFIVGALTSTIYARPAFTNFVNCQARSIMWNFTWTGLATGQRYYAAVNGVINTYGKSTTWLPGDAAGTTATGGQYA